MVKRKRGKGRGAKDKSCPPLKCFEGVENEQDCISDEEEVAPAQPPEATPQSINVSEVKFSENDSSNPSKGLSVAASSSISRKAPKLRRTTSRVLGKISLEDAIEKAYAVTKDITTSNSNVFSTEVYKKETEVYNAVSHIDDKLAVNKEAGAVIDSGMSENKKHFENSKIKPFPNDFKANKKTLNSSSTFNDKVPALHNKIENIAGSSIDIDCSTSNLMGSTISMEGSGVEVLGVELNSHCSGIRNPFEEQEEEEELIYEDVNDQGTEKESPVNIDDVVINVPIIENSGVEVGNDSDKDVFNDTEKKKILIKLPQNKIINTSEQDNMCDEPAGLIDIQFSDLNLEKEFKTESVNLTAKIASKNSSPKKSDCKSVLKKNTLVLSDRKESVVLPKNEPGTIIKKEICKSTNKDTTCSQKVPVSTHREDSINIPKQESLTQKRKLITAPKKDSKNIALTDSSVSSSSTTIKKKITTGSEKSAPAHILGLSFIIGIKVENKQGKPTFDCVLCNKEDSFFNGATMHTHVKSRKHILNAMEVHNYSLFEKYKNDETVKTDDMLQIMIEYEKSQKKQHLVVATSQNYKSARQNVTNKIKNIKESVMQGVKQNAVIEKEKLDHSQQKLNNFRTIVKIGIINVSQAYKEELNELVNLQMKRAPKNIVLVLDEREDGITNFVQKELNFSTLNFAEINFQNAFDLLKNHSLFDKGTAFIFLGLTYEFLEKIDLPDCVANDCVNPAKIIDVSDKKHIAEAIKLHKQLLNNTQNDILLFTGLMPVHIFAYNTTSVNKRLCCNVHEGDIPKREDNSSTEAYMVMLKNFNSFVQEHSKILGFSKWSFEKTYFNSPSKSRKSNFFSRNGINYLQQTLRTRKDETRRWIKSLDLKLTKKIKGLECSKNIPSEKFNVKSEENPREKGIERSHGKSSEKSGGITSERSNGKASERSHGISSERPHGKSSERLQVSERSQGTSSRRSHGKSSERSRGISSERSRGISSERPRERLGRSNEKIAKNNVKVSKPLIGDSPIGRAVTRPREPKYEKVVILANNLYEPLLKELNSDRIVVMAEEDLSCSQLKSYFLRKKTLMPSNTLWLSATGIFSIANRETTQACRKQNCYFPLRSLVPCCDMQNVPGAAKVINELAYVMTETIKEIKSVMSADSDFMIIPPIPVSIVNEDLLHLELHSIIQKYPNYFVATKADIEHLNLVYKILCKEISSASIRECHLPYNSAHMCLHADLSIEEVDAADFTENQKSFNVWKETLLNFISDCLTYDVSNGTDSTKVIDMTIEEDEDFLPSRIVIFDDMSSGQGKNSTKHREPDSVNFSAIPSKNPHVESKFLFDKIVFIGSANSLKLASKLNKNLFTIPPQTYYEIKNPVYWSEFIKQCKEWKSSNNSILFIFITDLSMIAKDIKDNQCIRWKCKDHLVHKSLSMISSKVSEFQLLVNGVMDICLENSKVMLTPICPRACIHKQPHNDRKLHSQLHNAVIHKSHPLLLEGSRSQWIDASESLEKACEIINTKIAHSKSNAIDISSVTQDQKSISSIEWKLPNMTSLDCASLSEEKWLQVLEISIRASLKMAKQIDSYTQECSLISRSNLQHPTPVLLYQTPVLQHSTPVLQHSTLLLQQKNSLSQHPSPKLHKHTTLLPNPPPLMSLPNLFHQNAGPSSQFSQSSYTNPESAISFIDCNQAPANIEFAPNVDPGYTYEKFSNTANSTFNSDPAYSSLANANLRSKLSPILNTKFPSTSANERPPLLQQPPESENLLIKSKLSSNNAFPQTFIQDFQGNCYNQTYEEFMNSLANVCDSFRHPPVFERVVFIGKKEIVDPLLKVNVESSVIYHNLANIEESDTQGVLQKLGNIRPRTLCCLIFGLSVITKAQTISSGCTNYNCRQPIPITVLKSYGKKGRDLYSISHGDVISNRLQSVSSFIKCLSKYLPVIVLPLYPSRIYCDSGTNAATHNISHALHGQENYVVSGTNIIWDQYFLSLTLIWNDLLEVNHKEFQSSLLIAKYIEWRLRPFHIKENLNDFFAHWTEPTVWKTFSEAVLQSLVLLKSLNSSTTDSLREIGRTFAKNKPVAARKSRFSKNTIKDPNSPAVIKIWNISNCIPNTFFSDLFKAIDASAQVAANKDNFVVEFSKRNGAELLAYKLNECQIANTTLRAEIIGEEGEKHNLNQMQDTYITSIFNQIYAKWKYLMIETLKKKIISVMDVTTFKTTKCSGNCEGIDKCMYYHNASDKRRNPLQCKYSQKMCSRPRNPLGYCNLGDSCLLSHNIYEQMFFPTNFQTILCPTNNLQLPCFKKPLCKFAHIDSPEMFYNEKWEDIVVFGTHNTLDYFAGAIRGLSKVNTSNGEYKVVLISPSTEFLDVAEKAVSGVTRNHRVKVTTLLDRWMNLESYQVLLGTPAVLANSQNQIFSAKTGGALIIDNVKNILANNSDSDAILKFIQKIKSLCTYKNNVNKVFVSSVYDDKISGVLSRFVGLKLKEVREPEPVKDAPLIVLDGSPPRHSGIKKSKSPLLAKPFSPPRRNRSNSCERTRGHKRSPPRSRNRRSRSRSTSKKFKARPRSPSPNKHRLSESNSQWKLSGSQIESSSFSAHAVNLGFIGDSEFKSDPQICSYDSNEVLNIASQNVSANLRTRFGPKLYEEFLKEEMSAKEKFEEEYKVFKDVSELHPDYEIYFEDFISKYNIQHRYKGEKHKETLWNQFWKVKFPEVKQVDWEQVRKELVRSFEGKLSHSQSRYSDINQFEMNKHLIDSDKFSIENTLILLEGFCSKLGMLGPALQAMIKSSRELGINNKKALEVFTDSENKLLINMVLDKLKNLQLEAPRNLIPTFMKAIEWTVLLLEVAEKGAEQTTSLDLNAIAKASVGKDSNYVVDLIKTALAYEGNSFPSKDVVNDIFLKICSIHFNMAMG